MTENVLKFKCVRPFLHVFVQTLKEKAIVTSTLFYSRWHPQALDKLWGCALKFLNRTQSLCQSLPT